MRMRIPKCKICKQEALWAMQYMDPGYKPTFTLLGNHYRGTKVTKVCPECKDKIQAITDPLRQKDIFDRVNRPMLEPLG